MKDQSTELSSIADMTVRRFILDLQEKPGTKAARMSSHTVYNRVTALRSFFNWLYSEGFTDHHILQNLKQPRTTRLVIEPLNTGEIDRVFRVIKSGTVENARNLALISIMLDTGLRLSEVTSLRDQDVHMEDQYVKVMGKGGKERVVAFGMACRKALLNYRHRFRADPVSAGVDAFFLNIDGYEMTADALRSLVKRIARASGVTRLHPHLLRHTYATMFLLNGGDVYLLKQNLGHSTLAMVENYVHIASQSAVARSQGFSPLDRLPRNRTRGRRSAA